MHDFEEDVAIDLFDFACIPKVTTYVSVWLNEMLFQAETRSVR